MFLTVLIIPPPTPPQPQQPTTPLSILQIDLTLSGLKASPMASPTVPQENCLEAIRRQVELLRQHSENLVRELEAHQREVDDLIRIRADLIARSKAFEKDVKRRLDEMLEDFQRKSAGRQA
ncbi:hypothetical protein MMC22_004427 [Lobaria immixta]|nr:hypothetical protein [Lobaria immixta]